jgi:5-methylcytosine-specific restriction enzyme A
MRNHYKPGNKKENSLLNELKPKAKQRVMDLVRAAGVDVTDWGKYDRGPRFASVNPKYCYEWAFVVPGRIVVVNLWHARIQVRRGIASIGFNLRENIRKYPKTAGKGIWKTRAEKLDLAFQEAAKHKLPIRAIINEGTMHPADTPKAKASSVDFRLLDPTPWAIESYDWDTGKCTLVRGALPGKLVDQFSFPPEEGSPTERLDVSGSTFIRNPKYRALAIERANGKCEYCAKPGFTTDDGSLFLETHHIIPLGEGGRDAEDNVVAVCPDHHREAHYGSRREDIRRVLHNLRSR